MDLYHCFFCSNEFIEDQHDNAIIKCPQCGSHQLEWVENVEE